MSKMKLKTVSAPRIPGEAIAPAAGEDGTEDGASGSGVSGSREARDGADGANGTKARERDGKDRTKADEKAREERTKLQGQSLEFAISQIRKKCGQGSIMYLGADYKANVQVIPTGVLSLDVALGVGGVPMGRIVEIFGPESSGKTTLTLHIVANAQRAGGNAAFIDAEHALDPKYAKRLGVNLDTLLVSQPDSGEQALEIAEHLISSNAMSVVVIDSVAALVPRAELEGEMGDSHVGLHARLMSQALRKLTAIVSKFEHLPHLHQPDPGEDRCDVRQSGDDHGRAGAQVLFLGEARHPPPEPHQGWRDGEGEPDPRQGREKQGGAPLPPGGVRRPLRPRGLPLRRPH